MIGALLNDRYRIEAELGQGGMGVVYRAHDMLLDRDVAVKALNRSGLGTEGSARLLREAQAVAQLNHPNIVSVYDAGETDGAPFIVMELVGGASLRNAGTLTIPQVMDLAQQLCQALDHAHSRHIIHRDVKPENIIVARTGDQLAAKLMDFGLARSRGASHLTQEGALVGTLSYLAPEQAMGQEVDGRADLYALGVVLYELVAGRLPFTGDPITVITQHLQAPVVPPSTFRPDLPPALEAIILKLLAKKPEDRFASAREVALALKAETLVPEMLGISRPSNNLPAQLTSFIGREKEIAEIQNLTSAHRLVTLTGPGGTGKTRLALQAAAGLLDAFPDGTWLIELAPLADPAVVPQTVATALRAREEAGRPILATLTDHLRAKTMLLLLDNCEHLIDACAQLAETLLQACPNLRILASSREALGIAGEMPFRVPSLSLPPAEPRRLPPIETLAQYDAVRLFVERAAAALPGFTFTAENAPAIAQVCHRLDGIPLAIELAAARVKLLRVEQIAARLGDCFRLLTGGSRTALPRQQTLRASIDWSYGLLPEEERAVLRRLSVCGRLDLGSSRVSRGARCCSLARRPGLDGAVGEQVARHRGARARSSSALPYAGNDPAVCARKTGRVGRARARAPPPFRVLFAAGRASCARVEGTSSSRVARPAGRQARQLARGAGLEHDKRC